MTRRLMIALSSLVAVSGCTVGPDHKSPVTQAPAAWPAPLEAGLTAGDPELREWWRVFRDPTLEALVDRALSGNLDLREAAARVREARARRGVTAADRLPSVDVSGSGSYSRSSENVFGGPGGAAGEKAELYDVGFDAAWELDIFGGVRRAVEAADADVAAFVESERDVRVILLAEVARNYVEFRSFQARLAIAHENVRIQQDTLALSQERLEAGLSSELEVAQARSQLESTRSLIPALATDLNRAAFRLDVLLGLQPGTLIPELASGSALPPTPARVPVGLPAELLRRRPDVREQELRIAAATARIGVATADLYPRFTLFGSFGLESDDFGRLFDADSRTWSAGPVAVRWPLFDAGRIRNNIRVQEAQQEQAIAAYERTVLEAYEEVANALIGYARVRERRESLTRAVEADQLAVEVSTELWSKGLTDFLNVLETQRSLSRNQDQLAESEAAMSISLIALYKALGGGWEPAAADPAPTAADSNVPEHGRARPRA